MSHLLFVDTETTGLDPIENEVLSIGISLCDADTFEVVDRREWYIQPERIETASPKALEVNGYTPEKWAAAGERPGIEVFAEVAPWMERGVFAGHNCPFDIGFLWEAAKRLGIVFPARPTEFIDTRHLSELLYNARKIPNNKLDSLVAYFGFSRQGFHGALEDADLSRMSAQLIYAQYIDDVYSHRGKGGEAIVKLAVLGEEARMRKAASIGAGLIKDMLGAPGTLSMPEPIAETPAPDAE
jgi:DNA polymerase III alpha subunit (gram-positive type)